LRLGALDYQQLYAKPQVFPATVVNRRLHALTGKVGF